MDIRKPKDFFLLALCIAVGMLIFMILAYVLLKIFTGDGYEAMESNESTLDKTDEDVEEIDLDDI